MSVYRPKHEPWHDYLRMSCSCDPSYSERNMVDDRCEYHRLLFAVDDLRDFGWTVVPPAPERLALDST